MTFWFCQSYMFHGIFSKHPSWWHGFISQFWNITHSSSHFNMDWLPMFNWGGLLEFLVCMCSRKLRIIIMRRISISNVRMRKSYYRLYVWYRVSRKHTIKFWVIYRKNYNMDRCNRLAIWGLYISMSIFHQEVPKFLLANSNFICL